MLSLAENVPDLVEIKIRYILAIIMHPHRVRFAKAVLDEVGVAAFYLQIVHRDAIGVILAFGVEDRLPGAVRFLHQIACLQAAGTRPSLALDIERMLIRRADNFNVSIVPLDRQHADMVAGPLERLRHTPWRQIAQRVVLVA